RVLGVLDRVAVADHGDRQPPEAAFGLHLVVLADGDIDRDRPLACRVEQREAFVLNAPFAHRHVADDCERRHTSQYCYSPPHGLHPDQIFLPYRRENAQLTERCPPNWIKFTKFSTWPLEPFWLLQIRRRFVAAPQSRDEPSIVPSASERGVAAVDHE